jgi:hypothetical protein
LKDKPIWYFCNKWLGDICWVITNVFLKMLWATNRINEELGKLDIIRNKN